MKEVIPHSLFSICWTALENWTNCKNGKFFKSSFVDDEGSMTTETKCINMFSVPMYYAIEEFEKEIEKGIKIPLNIDLIDLFSVSFRNNEKNVKNQIIKLIRNKNSCTNINSDIEYKLVKRPPHLFAIWLEYRDYFNIVNVEGEKDQKLTFHTRGDICSLLPDEFELNKIFR